MQKANTQIIQIIEGTTKILVPLASLNDKVPPKKPAFFNPKAKLNRDFSIIAYSAFLKKSKGSKLLLEGLSGLGARGLRVANEIKSVEKVIINDLNPYALQLANQSAELNRLKNFELVGDEICRFFSNYSKKGQRGLIVDIDPFGSPAKFIDCGIRATRHGGLLSSTATDLQVLHGIFPQACFRRYGGRPLKTQYSNELAIRLILGCIRNISARLDIEIIPLFVESDMHYYRTYIRVLNRTDQKENIGFIFHCYNCGNRGIQKSNYPDCLICKKKISLAGPLWIGQLFDKMFIESMISELDSYEVDKSCKVTLEKCNLESTLPATYFTLDEISSKLKKSPPKLKDVILSLQTKGFLASPTSLNPTGFRTNASIKEISEIF